MYDTHGILSHQWLLNQKIYYATIYEVYVVAITNNVHREPVLSVMYSHLSLLLISIS